MGKSIKGVAGNAEELQKASKETYNIVENMVVSVGQVAQNAQNVNSLSDVVKADIVTGKQIGRAHV